MNLDKALDELNRAPDLATPSLPALAYLLRHPDLWPEGFVWSFPHARFCAMGLAARFWEGTLFLPEPYTTWTRRTFELDFTTTDLLFVLSYADQEVTAANIAERIDRYLATTEL